MDQNTITDYLEPLPGKPLPSYKEGDAWLGGGTFLFSTPLPHLRRMVDLTTLQWPDLIVSQEGLEIGATCTIERLHQFQPPADWLAGPVLKICVEAFLASFKIWHVQTVGGNICTSLPAGPMITLTCALEAQYELWLAGERSRTVPAIEFVTGDNANILQPGELLRKIIISREAFDRKYAFRRFTLTHAGRSSVFLVGTLDRKAGECLLTVTAATIHPVHLRFPSVPSSTELQDALSSSIPDELYFDDPNGRPDHRKHLTHIFARQICQELGQDN